jgi:hypothetical protein
MYNSLAIQGSVNITNTTSSFSKTTSALIVLNGVEIGENLNIGGNISITSTQTFTSNTTGALVVSNGVEIGGIGENVIYSAIFLPNY